MQIKLMQQEIQDFMGIRKFDFSPRGMNATISAMNGKGKTTLFTNFLWILFGKNAEGKADFAIKTLDENNNEIHNLNHSGKLVFDIDGTQITLEKTYHEVYTKKRGTSHQEFTGHTTDYAIDGVPVQKKEWDNKISELFNEDLLKLLTDPMYFNSDNFRYGKQMKPPLPAWKQRRNLLFELDPDLPSDDEIMSEELRDILKGKAYEDYQKIIKARQTAINNRQKEIPARIDELNNSVADVSGFHASKIEIKIKNLENKIQDMKADTTAATLRQQRLEIKTQINEATDKLESLRRTAKKEASKELDEIQNKLQECREKLKKCNLGIESKINDIADTQKKIDNLKEDFNREKAQKYNPPSKINIEASKCPNCNYVLNQSQIDHRDKEYEESVKAAEKCFNLRQAETLKGYNAKGKVLVENLKAYEIERENLLKSKATLQEEIKTLEAREKEKQEHIALQEKINIVGKEEMNQLDDLHQKLTDVDKKIEGAQVPDTTDLESQVKAERVKLAQIESNKKTRDRMEELAQEEKTLATEYEKLEGELAMIEKFIVQKVSLLEERINGKFNVVKWKLFSQNINGGIEECCTALINGTPWDRGASGGEQIYMGCDCIETLQKHFDMYAPCWIDNMERCTFDIDMPCQTVFLKVDEQDKELNVKYF